MLTRPFHPSATAGMINPMSDLLNIEERLRNDLNASEEKEEA